MVDEVTVPRFVEVDNFHADIPMLQNGWRPTGGPVNVAADEGLLNWPLQRLVDRSRYLKSGLDALNLKAGSVVTVGPGGTYATINAALTALSDKRPAYVSGGVVTEIRLLAGFVMAEQVHVSGVNLGWLKITSVDAVVTINRAALTTLIIDRYPAFAGTEGAVLPVIDAQFEMNTAGVATDRDGIMVRGATAKIEAGRGVRRAGGSGLHARSTASVTAVGADFSQAGANGIYARSASQVNAYGAVLTGCGADGCYAESGSTVTLETATLTGAVGRGIVAASGSRISCSNSNARKGGSDSSSDIVVQTGAMISAVGATGGTNVTANTVTASGIIIK